MRQVARQAEEVGNCVFYPGVFNETLALLFDAHNYFQQNALEEQAVMPAAQRAIYANEMTRVTMRLTSIMAWLMVRKAVFAGRISPEEALHSYPLEARDECLIYDNTQLDFLPYYVGYLSERSYMLYERVSRLESLLSSEYQIH